jgi:GT2 family glycosyltransferase
VVDQSGADVVASAVGDLIDDKRLVIVRSDTTGVSRGRNIGLQLATRDIVLITDDDVTVPTDWARRFHAQVSALESVAVAFCRVDAGPHDSELGFIPEHEVTEHLVVRSLLSKSRARGIGAGMAVRRRDILSIGGFDEQLGPGARLRSGEDRDLAARALAAGWWVLQVPDAFVIHHGFRTWAEGKSLTRRDWYGIGAAYAKQLKCCNFAIVPVIAHEALWYGMIKPIARFAFGRRRTGLRRIGYFATGFVAGLRTPLDRRTLLYLDEATSA